MKNSVYIETTIISYVTSRPSRDLVAAAHQQVTLDWWENRRRLFDVYVSPLVVHECSEGDSDAATKRMSLLDGIPQLEVNEAAVQLAEVLLRKGPLPDKAADDALHLAVAAVHGIDFLLTWNCRHLANAELMPSLGVVVGEEGYDLPTICTPDELMGENDEA